MPSAPKALSSSSTAQRSACSTTECTETQSLSAKGRTDGLRIPGREIEPGRGEAQRAECLQALALHEAR